MKVVRFKVRDTIRHGILRDGRINESHGDILNGFKESGMTFAFDEVVLLPPTEPSKVVAIGLNYKEHARELNMELPKEPLIFLKPKSSVIASGEDIIYPEMSEQVDYEGELGVIVGRRAKNIAKNDAKDYILGYTCVNDVTARDLQRLYVQFTRAKSFDTFCPAGPCMQTELNPDNVMLKTYVNGELRQGTNTNDMIFHVFEVLSFISSVMTLEPGDLITTGTPKGVAHLNRGDEVVVEIENIGRLINRIV